MTTPSNLHSGQPLPGRIGGEEGFLDIDLPLVSAGEVEVGRNRFVALGTVAGVNLGFAVTLGSQWHAKQTDDGSATLYWGIASCERTGVENDNFIRFVASAYGLPMSDDLSMILEVPAEVVGLNINPECAMQSGAKMKFFFHSSSPVRHAEVFINIDIEQGILAFHEKDNDYRKPLLLALTEA